MTPPYGLPRALSVLPGQVDKITMSGRYDVAYKEKVLHSKFSVSECTDVLTDI